MVTVPETIKNYESLKMFKQKIRKWKPHCNMLVSSNNSVFSFTIIIVIGKFTNIPGGPKKTSPKLKF